MLDQSLERLAQEFWAGTDPQDTFPRNIEHAIAMRLPLAVVKLAPLNMRALGRWLEQQHITTFLPSDQRDLLGCLVAYRGHGIVFVSGFDTPEEQRLTLAHEAAHFLVDYLWPRQQVIQTLGEAMAEVLDGLRAATPAERAAATLSHVRVGAHVHLLPRPGKEEDEESVVAHAEDRADRLAFELVAPWAHLRCLLQNLSTHGSMSPEQACSALAAHFGLPPYAFDRIVRKMSQRRPVSFLADISNAIRKQR